MPALSSAKHKKTNGNRRAEICGWGMYAPARVVTNDDLSKIVDTSDEWIRSRTGIVNRHLAGAQETTSQMAIEAARAALASADENPHHIDLIIVGTATPDYMLASTACQVQNALGATHSGAFDLSAGCSGFVYALTIGQQAISSGACELVLVIGADTLSRTLDWQDRSTCVLFGDGAGAVLLRPAQGDGGVLSTVLGADGSGSEMLFIPAGGSAIPASADSFSKGLHYLKMNGGEVYRFATRILAEAAEAAVKKAGLTLKDIDLIIPHQANTRIIESAAKRLKLPMDRFAMNLQEYGNTSAASIPIALCESLNKQRIQPGHNLLLVGFGAGLTWAAAVVRWSAAPVGAQVRYRGMWRWIIYGSARLRSLFRLMTIRSIRTIDKHANRGTSRK
ncbi:MAG: beta-ketoacyl-ACP synthase III [Anaerolineae bacterium]